MPVPRRSFLFAGAALVVGPGVRSAEEHEKSDESDTDTRDTPNYDLEGVWKSDWELTKQHIETNCKLKPEAITGLERLMGKMTVRYEGGRIICSMPELRFSREDGQEAVLPPWESNEVLNVIGRAGNQVAVRNQSELPGFEDWISVITFEDADIYWIYVGHLPITSLHVREYFRRVIAS